MTQNGTLSAKQVQFLSALLSSANTRDAARKVGISDRTAWRWLKDALFQAELARAKQEAFDESLDLLKSGVRAAIATLARNMKEDQPPGVQVRAAQIWLEQAVQLHKMSEIEAHFAELERALKTTGLARRV